jgi:hypothetical protein
MTGSLALLIGIEEYAAGPGWQLDGPAVDACRFAHFLLDIGVQRDRINLLSSPMPVNGYLIEQTGVTRHDANQATVSQFLTRWLPQQTSDLLFVYWGGHGVVDGEGNRRLFYSDATQEDRRNLDATSMLSSLLTDFFPHHPNQLIIVDACQNLTSDLGHIKHLPRETVAGGRLIKARDQRVLFAASPGEYAGNSGARKSGYFSERVLQELRTLKAWPPDVDRLASGLDDQFTKLRAQGRAAQTPLYLWRRSSGREGLVFSLPPTPMGRRRLSLSQLERLASTLLDLDEVADTPNRQRIVLLMPVQLRNSVQYSDRPITHVLSWIRACEPYATGRASFVGALKAGISDVSGLARVLAVVDEVWPVHDVGSSEPSR